MNMLNKRKVRSRMGVTYEDAVKAQRELEDAVLADPNVVSVGVVAETNVYGEATGDYAVQVGVVSIDAYLSAKKYGHSSIPSEFLLDSKSNSESDKHVHIHVVREGNIEALSKFSETEKSDIPSAIDNLPQSEVSVDNYISRLRPSPCGQSISHPNTTAGTQGLLLEYTEGPNVGKAYILSNNHVIAANNFAGSDAASYCNPMGIVLSSLSMSYTHKYPFGKKFSFNSDFNLRVVQKRHYSTISLPNFSSEILFFRRALKSQPAKKCVVSLSAISALGLFKNPPLTSAVNNTSNICKKIFSWRVKNNFITKTPN